jgi:quinol-cytochrome oxidoreductase complex cytochrome b subunit
MIKSQLKYKILSVILSTLFIVSIVATLQLVYTDYTIGNVCPKLLGVPACYIILLCFIIPFLVHHLKGNSTYYFLGTGLAFLIALYGSAMQVLSYISCPKTNNNIPMCFISLGIFTSLIILKILIKKNKHEK